MTVDQARERFEAGLRLDHLDPGSILLFLRRLPHRVASKVDPAGPRPDAERPEVGVPGSDEAQVDRDARIVRFRDHLTTVVDELDDLIDRLQAANYPLSTEVSVTAIDDLDARPPELAALLRRIEAGATEAARRLAGLPTAGWTDHPGLLEAARSTVGRISWELRQLDPAGPDPDDD